MSESPGAKLARALVAFQAEVTNPKNTARNPHFGSGFAPLPDLLDHYRPLLAKHGLAALQLGRSGSGIYGVSTLLVHESGESLDCGPLCFAPQRNDPQGAASAVTYARRYSYCAALGIASEDEDDDGNTASRPAGVSASAVKTLYENAKDREAFKAADTAAKGLSDDKKREVVAARKAAAERLKKDG